ncbi:MAG: chemotaxis protein CheD [Candidatus Bathyarchaeota archaeon]|nr:chemotaxis protein CheD [Candidatus Bathyarchaeota archaeon]
MLTAPIWLHQKTGSIIDRSHIGVKVGAITKLQTITTTTIETTTKTRFEEIRVNMAEMKAEKNPVKLVTSVGSCVAICLYDSANMCGGLAHIMLPKSAIAPHESLPGKFADTAVPSLANEVRKLCRKESRLSAKIAGGANMFPNMNALNIGAKNVEAVKEALAQHKIRLIAEDVGGSHGRRISFEVETGNVTVKVFNGETIEL